MSAMSHPDEDLIRLFAETPRSLPDEEFVARVMTRVGRERRRRARLRLTRVVIVCLAAAAATPYVAEGSLEIGRRSVEGFATLGAALSSPAGWAVSIPIALWTLWQARVIGKR